MEIQLIDVDDLVGRHVQPKRTALLTNYYVYGVERQLKRHVIQLCQGCEELARHLH